MITRLAAALAATTLFGTACSAGSTPPAPESAASSSSATSATATTAVPAQLQFTAQTLDGKQFKGESLLGKPAALWFWAPWCPTCQKEAPMVGQAARAHQAVTFVGVSGLDQRPAMQEFVDKYPVKDITQLADIDGSVWAKFGVTHQPAYAFVSKDGGVEVVKGSLSEAELTQRLTALANP